MDDSEWEGSLQTNRDRVNCSMPADYNDSTSADSAVRLLCRLIAGADVSPLPPNRRAALLECARVHRVDRLAMHAIRMRGEPTDLWFGMAAGEPDVERTWAVLDAVRTRELHAVTATLARVSGAEPIVFKGAALAHSHYPASWLRPRLDTDVLISPTSVAAALLALQALGYARAVSTAGELVLSQTPLTRTDSFGVEHALDLHWKIANWQAIAMVLSHDEIATRAVPLPAAGPDARAASNRDALLIACLHRTAHHRDSGELLWLYDIHLLAGEMAEADWIEFVSAGRRGEVKTLLRRSLALATERFQTRIPAFVMRQLEIGANSAPERSAVFLSTDLRLVDGLMSDLRALRGRKRAQLIAEHLFPPAAYIRQRYQPTSRISMAFYYIRRIVFGLPRWFTARRNS